jgi:hypothetical protein
MSEAEQSRLLQELENWCLILDFIGFWKESKRKYALATAAANCAEAIDKMFVSDSQSLTAELLNPHRTQATATAMTAALDQEYNHTRQGSANEEQKH